MDKLVINGQKILNGIVEISGAKNAVLPVMVATLFSTWEIQNFSSTRSAGYTYHAQIVGNDRRHQQF